MISLTKLLVSVHTMLKRMGGNSYIYACKCVYKYTYTHYIHTHTDIQPPGASANRKWALVGGGGGAHLTGVLHMCIRVYVSVLHVCIRVYVSVLYIQMWIQVYTRGLGIGRVSPQEIKWLLVTHRLPELHTESCTPQCNRFTVLLFIKWM